MKYMNIDKFFMTLDSKILFSRSATWSMNTMYINQTFQS